MEYLKEIKKVNLATYYLLPAVGLSTESFGLNNFVNTFLPMELESNYSIVVEIVSENLLPENFKGFTFITDGTRSFVEVKVPSTWNTDVELFLEGKYSKLSKELKDLILQYSNLAYMVEKNGVFYTDVRLLALDKSKELENVIVDSLYDDKDHQKGADFVKDIEFLPAPGKEHVFTFDHTNLQTKTL